MVVYGVDEPYMLSECLCCHSVVVYATKLGILYYIGVICLRNSRKGSGPLSLFRLLECKGSNIGCLFGAHHEKIFISAPKNSVTLQNLNAT